MVKVTEKLTVAVMCLPAQLLQAMWNTGLPWPHLHMVSVFGMFRRAFILFMSQMVLWFLVIWTY
jgi:hypothetical protein